MKRLKIIALISVLLLVVMMTACETKDQSPEESAATSKEAEVELTAEKLLVDNGEWICMDGEFVYIAQLTGDLKFKWYHADIKEYDAGNGVIDSGVYTINGNEITIITVHDEGEPTEETYTATVEGETITLSGKDSTTVSFAGMYKKMSSEQGMPEVEPTQVDTQEIEAPQEENTTEDAQSEYVFNDDVFSDIGLTYDEVLNKRGPQTGSEYWRGGEGFTFQNGYGLYFFESGACDYIEDIAAANIFEELTFGGILYASDIGENYPVSYQGIDYSDHDSTYISMLTYKDYDIAINTDERGTIHKFSWATIYKN